MVRTIMRDGKYTDWIAQIIQHELDHVDGVVIQTLELIKKEYEAVSKTIMEMQMALDKYNQTVQFEVDI